jgi:FeS assembly SUF system protein
MDPESSAEGAVMNPTTQEESVQATALAGTPDVPVAAPAAPESGSSLEARVADAARQQELQDQVLAVLRTCFDPEIPVNIVELGLIYGVEVNPAGAALIRMTLTSPACPAAGSLPPEVEAKTKGVPGITGARVEVVWDPIWGPERMSEAARLQLGIDL